ncbi:MAG: AAA family ATPase, partial [Lentisphaerota bacterium]
RLAESDKTLEERQARLAMQAQLVKDMVQQRSTRAEQAAKIQQSLGELKTKAATRRAQIDLLTRSEKQAEGFPTGAKLLLDEKKTLSIDYQSVLGPLAQQIHADPQWRAALESALRAWLDAVVVADVDTAFRVISQLQQRAEGSAHLLSLTCDEPEAPACPAGAGSPLMDHVQCDPKAIPLLRRLIGNVRVVSDLSDIPRPVPSGLVYVTAKGALVRGNGSLEYWMAEEHETNPLARKHAMTEWQKELDGILAEMQNQEKQLKTLQSDEKAFEQSVQEARTGLEECQRNMALCEGERQIISQQARQARERAETVSWELDVLQKQTETGGDRKSEIIAEMDALRSRQTGLRTETVRKTDELQSLEEMRTALNSEATDIRIKFAEHRQQVDHLLTRKEPLEARIREIEALIKDRADGINSYQARIQDLAKSSQTAEARIAPLQEDMEKHTQRLEASRTLRAEKMLALSNFDSSLRVKRAKLDDLRAKKSEMDVELAEQRMRRQNLVDRISSDYHINTAQMQNEPEPEWENNQKPDRETMEITVAEIRTKLESMGPVNLVAIEEHDELEKRFTFLTQQQDDLINAKQQLLDLIRKINSTTTDMFKQTFDTVNVNFQELFKKLFGGGSAKLVLVDEENVLESGIEIIARPPGKKLQSVSLLSGGERTMTAVALLFALYMVKPSAFCVLDELDAALDESNIGRFLKMLLEFLNKSQFIVITHNRQTISAADVLYGVTMEEHGVSKIVSVKFSHHEKSEPAAKSAEPEQAPEQAPEQTPEPASP